MVDCSHASRLLCFVHPSLQCCYKESSRRSCDALRKVLPSKFYKCKVVWWCGCFCDFGRMNKHFRLHFRSTFKGCEYRIWATKRVKVLRKCSLKGLFVLPKSSFGEHKVCKLFQNTRMISDVFFVTTLQGWVYKTRQHERDARESNQMFSILQGWAYKTQPDWCFLCNNMERMGLQNTTNTQDARCIMIVWSHATIFCNHERPNKHVRVWFRSTFQRVAQIWYSHPWKVLRKHTLKGLFGLPKSSFGRDKLVTKDHSIPEKPHIA